MCRMVVRILEIDYNLLYRWVNRNKDEQLCGASTKLNGSSSDLSTNNVRVGYITKSVKTK
jgi:hypothetical protein